MAYNDLNTVIPDDAVKQGTTPGTIQEKQEETTPKAQEVNVAPKPVQFTDKIGANESELKAELNGIDDVDTSPWADGFEATLRKYPDLNIATAIKGYNDSAKKQGKEPLDILEIWPLMQNNDITKSLAENEKLEKKRADKEKWEQTANVLSHLGNFIGTIAGAPSQDIESSIELSKRQQILRDKTLEQRRQANSDYFKVYQASQSAKMAAEKEKREAAYQNETLRLKQAAEERQRDAQTIQLMKLNWQMQYQQGLLDLKKQQQEIDNAYKMGQLSLRGKQLALNELKANYTNVKVKPDGTVETIEHRVGASGTPAAPANNGGGNTAPWVH